MEWSLTEEVDTTAGKVVAGSTGSGSPVVLAHGWPWSSYSWYRLIPQLSKTHKVFWYDMPGYGKSEMFDGQITNLDVQGKIFGEMLEHWKLDAPVVVAHDFGGAATLRAHLLGGLEFSRYLLMNVVAMRPWGSEFFDHVGKHVDVFAALPKHIHAAIVEAYVRSAFVTAIGPEDVNSLMMPWLSPDGKRSFYSQFKQADEKYTAEVEPSFSAIRCPVKIIWGEMDPWIPVSRGEALRELIKPESFVKLKSVGHLPQLESPDVVLRHIVQFVDK